jgi:hypothetical protein
VVRATAAGGQDGGGQDAGPAEGEETTAVEAAGDIGVGVHEIVKETRQAGRGRLVVVRAGIGLTSHEISVGLHVHSWV